MERSPTEDSTGKVEDDLTGDADRAEEPELQEQVFASDPL